MISNLAIEHDSDRAILRQPVQWLDIAASEWGRMHDKWVAEIMPGIPGYIPLMNRLGSRIARQLEELACTTEDLAETLALATSEPFAHLVKEQLAANSLADVMKHETD